MPKVQSNPDSAVLASSSALTPLAGGGERPWSAPGDGVEVDSRAAALSTQPTQPSTSDQPSSPGQLSSLGQPVSAIQPSSPGLAVSAGEHSAVGTPGVPASPLSWPSGDAFGLPTSAGEEHSRLLADLSFLRRGISVRNERILSIIRELAIIAGKTTAPILFMAPTGAGKSLLVRRLYELKKQKGLIQGPLVELNCASVQGGLAQSMLFGHAKGAFTGASCAREGLLRKADKGMLFLDEIGTLGFEEQALLLKAIEDRRFYPLGSDREATSDFQLVCGTNMDLYAAVRAGTFRADLLSRCNTWTFVIPHIKDRPEDMEPNLDFELDQLMFASGARLSMEPRARSRFLDFAVSPQALWLGNFRDFGSSVQRMATFAQDGVIGLTVVEREIERLQQQWQGQIRGDASGFGSEVGQPFGGGAAPGEYPNIRRLLGDEAPGRFDLFELPQLELVLDVCRRAGTLAEAGRVLYAVSRNRRSSSNDSDRLRKYLARFGLAWEDVAPKGKKSDLLRAGLDQQDNSPFCRLT